MKVVSHLQDQAAAFIGVSPADRRGVIEAMLGRSTSDVVGYWLQLVLSMGIATLGLAMNSTAVVIGAMLISPLMSPLIELGAGLATGSLLLSFRAGVRTAGSIAVVVFCAAGVTLLLPFHEITPELAARTSPTMLDLFVAVFCALAAVYTTVRQSKDVMSAAAGTAIGISLVPPLCTAGYGLGVGHVEVFRGGLLLFTANFAAIIAVATIMILLLGFGQVQVGEFEGELLAATENRRVTHRAARMTRRIVGKRLGMLRLLVPAVLLVAIMLPLMRALEEVSWQVRVRSEVEDALATVPGAVVRQSLDVRGGTVRVRLFLVGSANEAQKIAADLRTKIAAFSGREPVVEVIAVPNAAALDAMASQLQTVVATPSTPTPPPPPPAAASYANELEAALARHWPSAAGEVLRLRTEVVATAPLALNVEITHVAPPLGAAGAQLLAQAWSAALEVQVDVDAVTLPTDALEAAPDDGERWLADLVPLLAATDGIDRLHLCVTVPAPPVAPAAGPRRRGPPPPSPPPSVELVRGVVEALARARPAIQIELGAAWRLRIQRDGCAVPTGASPSSP